MTVGPPGAPAGSSGSTASAASVATTGCSGSAASVATTGCSGSAASVAPAGSSGSAASVAPAGSSASAASVAPAGSSASGASAGSAAWAGSAASAAAAAPPASVDALLGLLADQRYLADASLGTVVFLGLRLGKPILLEGEAGVGKTEVAKVLAAALGRRLIRLQCYEGLDVASALYEWDFARQMLEIRLAEAAGPVERAALATTLYSERFLLRRPLLDALTADPAGPPVLLIDELDRTDEPFEAFLLEILSDFQVSIPELGTVRAPAPPVVILTSNRTREIHDALKRRCLYHWIDYPDAARELAILAARAPEVPARLAAQIVAFVHQLRATDLFKLPGVAETLDWGQALVALGSVELDPATVDATLGVLLKYQDDLAKITGPTAHALVDAARGAG